MKQLKFFLALFIGALLFTSCKKDKDDDTKAPPMPDIPGVYIGKYGTGNNTPSSFYSFNIKGDGTIQEINSSGLVVGTGTWTLNGKTFRASYHYTMPATAFFVASATYDPITKKLAGTWGYGSSDNDGGKWHMTKQ